MAAQSPNRAAGTHPGMHRTDTIDIGVVVSGHVRVEAEDGSSVTLRPGDVYVQNGAMHAWHEDPDDPALVVFVLSAPSAARANERHRPSLNAVLDNPPVLYPDVIAQNARYHAQGVRRMRGRAADVGRVRARTNQVANALIEGLASATACVCTWPTRSRCSSCCGHRQSRRRRRAAQRDDGRSDALPRWSKTPARHILLRRRDDARGGDAIRSATSTVPGDRFFVLGGGGDGWRADGAVRRRAPGPTPRSRSPGRLDDDHLQLRDHRDAEGHRAHPPRAADVSAGLRSGAARRSLRDTSVRDAAVHERNAGS